MGGPLDGIRIVEVGTMIAVPAATYHLATQGATVIKVEDPITGDELRHYGSQKGGMSAWFINANAGKQSIALDLREAAGKEVLWQLIARADVFVQGFRPGALERLGFGSAAVRQRHPQIVYCSSSGFGPQGPYANLPVYDPVVQALSGWAGAQTTPQGPTLVRAMVADKTAALTTSQAITAALVQRGRSGAGLHVEMNMLEANLNFVWPDTMMHASLLDDDALHRPNLAQSYRLFACEGGWITLATGTNAQWQAFTKAVGQPEVAEDPRLKTAADRANNVALWYDTMERLVAPFALDDIVARLRAADVPVAPAIDPAEVVNDPQVRAAELLEEFEHPVAGRVRRPRPSAAWFGAKVELTPAPQHGEHTDAILGELGYDAEQVAALRHAGAVGTKK